MSDQAYTGLPLGEPSGGARIPRMAAKRARERLIKVAEDIRLKDLPESLLEAPSGDGGEEDEEEADEESEDEGDEEWSGGDDGRETGYDLGTKNPAKRTLVKKTKYGSHTGDVTLEDLRAQFRYPAAQAAARLGVGTTILEKICRQHGVDRWPYQKSQEMNESREDQGSSTFLRRMSELMAGIPTYPGQTLGPGVLPRMGSVPGMGGGMGGGMGAAPMAGFYGMPSVSPAPDQMQQHDRVLIQSLSNQVSALKDMMEMVNQSLLMLMFMMRDTTSKPAVPQDPGPVGPPPSNEAADVNQPQPGTPRDDQSSFSSLLDQMRLLVNLHAQTNKGM